MNPYITKPIHRELLSTASLGDIWYLIFQQRPQWAPKYALANSRKSVFPTRESKERCNSARWIQSRKAVSQIAFFMAFIEGIIWFWQQELMGFEMSSHTFYKKSISNLLNHTHTQTNKQANKPTTGSTLGDKPRHHEAVSMTYSLWSLSGDIQFFTIGLKGSQMSLWNLYKESVSNLPNQNKGVTL